MNINKLLAEEIVFGGYGMTLDSFCKMNKIDSKEFALALIEKYSKFNIKKFNKKIKSIKKFKYDKFDKTFTFKIAGIKVKYAIICECHSSGKTNHSSILRKIAKIINSNKEYNLWYLLNYERYNPSLKIIGLANKT
jgi:hypothetical protein